MNTAELVREAAEDGVILSLSPVGKIKAMGQPSAVNRWLPLLVKRRDEVVQVLRKETHPTKQEAEMELRMLVREVAKAHGFTPEEEMEALGNALDDFDAALTCLRALRRELG